MRLLWRRSNKPRPHHPYGSNPAPVIETTYFLLAGVATLPKPALKMEHGTKNKSFIDQAKMDTN
jgi:hypothetical protein